MGVGRSCAGSPKTIAGGWHRTAIVLAALPVLGALAVVQWPTLTGVAFPLGVAATPNIAGCALATLALWRRWRWARTFALCLVSTVLLQAFAELVTRSDDEAAAVSLPLGWALWLFSCLIRQGEFDNREPQPAVGRELDDLRMLAARAAFILNSATLWILADALFASSRSFCALSTTFSPEATTYWLAIVLGFVSAIGLGLLAAHKTSGLLIMVVTATAFPLAVALAVAYRFREVARVEVLLIALPGMLASWAALALWVRPLARYLRGR